MTAVAPASQPAVEQPTVPSGAFVIIPAYNEGARIGRVLRQVRPTCPRIVVVDDGSCDDTFAVARHLTRYALRHAINRGQGAALQTGVEFALRRGAEYIVTFDADGQHRVDDIPRLLAPLVAGTHDIALGSRFLGKAIRIPLRRRITLWLGVIFTRTVSQVTVTDAHNGLRAFTRRAAERIHIVNDRMAHASELIDQIRHTGLPYCEVPVKIRYTADSLAKGQRLRAAFRILLDYFIGRVVR